MRKHGRFAIALALFALACSPAASAWGAAMHVATHGAAATASAWCVTARPLDASTIYYNPAGMGLLEGTHLLNGMNLFAYSVDYEAGMDSITSERGYFTPGHFFAHHTFANGLSFGFGLYTPYGLGGAFPNDWAGRYIFTEVEQQVYFFNPVVSVDLRKILPKAPEIYVAAGFRLAYGTTFMKQNVTFNAVSIANANGTIPWATTLLNNVLARNWTGKDTRVELDTDGFGTGLNIGILWRAREDLSIGVTYQSKIKITYEGTASFNPVGMNQALAELFFVNDTISMDFNYPDQVSVGIAYTPIDALTLEFDFWWGNWTEYKDLTVDFSNPLNTDIFLPQDFGHSYLLGLGAEYRPCATFPVRLGFAFDFTPVPDETVSPTMPDSDRPFILGGFGYHPEKWPLLPKKFHAFADFYGGIGFWERRKNNEIPGDIRKSLLPGTALEALEIVIDMEQARANGLYKPIMYMMGVSFGLNF